MKLSDLVILLAMLAIFLPLYAQSFSLIRKMDTRIEALRSQNASLSFISTSFYETCERKVSGQGKGYKSLDEWKNNCRLLWSLDSIEVEEILVNDDLKNIEKLLCGKWSGPSGHGEAYYRMKM